MDYDDGSKQKSKKQKTSGDADVEKIIKQCQAILGMLKKKDNAYPFLEPVNWKELKLPTYPKIIKNPMDLGTVEKRLISSKYAHTSEFAADVRLVWTNAKLFNQEGSEIHEWAKQLSADFEKRFSTIPDVSLLPVERSTPKAAASSQPPPTTSSGGGSSDREEWKRVVKSLRKEPIAEPFKEPVRWKELGIPDYPTIIKHPMDLGTILSRLDSNHYSEIEDLCVDVDQVWSNACKYNQSDSQIFKNAKALKRMADDKFQKLRETKKAAVPEAKKEKAEEKPVDDGQLTYEMKQQLNNNSNKLQSKELYGMVTIVQEHCPRAVDQSNPDEVEIDIDALDYKTFMEVDAYVKRCLKTKKKKNG